MVAGGRGTLFLSDVVIVKLPLLDVRVCEGDKRLFWRG